MPTLDNQRSLRAFETRFLHLVRSDKRQLAEALLRAAIRESLPGLVVPYGKNARIVGWDKLRPAMVDAADSYALRGKRLAVVAVDLVNRRYVGSPDGEYPPEDTISLQATFYDDPPERCARTCPRRMLSKQASRGQRDWRRSKGTSVKLDLDGIHDLVAFQRQLEHAELSSDEKDCARFLIGWLVWLRVEWSVTQAVASHGLPFSVPVIFGVDHVLRPMESNERDFGPDGETVYLAPEAPLTRDQLINLREARRAKEVASEKAYWEGLVEQTLALARAAKKLS